MSEIEIQGIHEFIYKKYGRGLLRKFPIIRIWKLRFIYRVFYGLKLVSPLNCLDYNKIEALKILKENLNLEEYGGKHHESVLTRFQQSYFLPSLFGYDKRRAHLSSLIQLICQQ